MIELTLKAIENNTITYSYKLENGNMGTVLYNKLYKATKIDKTISNSYYKHLHSALMIMGKTNSFPKHYTIAWY